MGLHIVTGETSIETWIYVPESKQQFTIWAFQNEPKLTKVVRSCNATNASNKCCFFSYTRHVATVALEDRRTVNTDWYTTICLPEVINELRRTNRNRRIILHYDASCHTARQTVDFLSSKNSELMIHCLHIHLIYHLMISFCSQTLKRRCVVSDLSRLKQLLKHFVH